MLIREDFNNPSIAFDLRYTGLRPGFQKLDPDQKLTVKVNGVRLFYGPSRDHLTVIRDHRLESSVAIIAESAMTKPAQEFWQMQITYPSFFHQERNIVSIKLDENKTDISSLLTDADLGVFYNTKWNITSGPHLYKEHVTPKVKQEH